MPLKRRKGKQWAASRSTGAPATAAAANSSASDGERDDENAAGGADDEATKIEAIPEDGIEKVEEAQLVAAPASTGAMGDRLDEPLQQSPKSKPLSSQQDPNLVLTSEKRKGVYECDYCYTDISQLPRIRCAVCSDFDLCLTCFATVDQKQTLQRLKAQASAHQAVGAEAAGSSTEEGGAVDATGVSLAGSGVSPAVLGHDASHGYRVCDSTRYPLFPTARNLSLKGVVQSLEDKLNESASAYPSGGDSKNETKNAAADDAMDVDEAPSPDGAMSSNDKDAAPTTDNKETETSSETKVIDEAPGGEEGPANVGIESFMLVDDPRSVWTIEEDLRLLDAIKTHGLGNWGDISDAVSGHGSVGKTPKRCMERYLDDFLGRYGHVLPPYMLLEQGEAGTNTPTAPNPVAVNSSSDSVADDNPGRDCAATAVATTESVQSEIGSPAPPEATTEIRSSKRRSALMRSPSSIANLSMTARKRFKAVPTELSPGYQQLWPDPFVPDGAMIGQDVGREQSYKAEQTFVKMISQLENQEKVEELRKEWEEEKLFKPGGPTVLPMRPEDVVTLPGAELAGFMPRRGDFDIEWENDAEQIVADMEFLPREPAQDRELKLKVLAIYNAKLEERERRKRFVLSRKLYDYRSIQTEEQKLPRDERDLIHRMRLFERFHTPAEHKQFLADLLKAKRLRKEIAKLQMYRRMGIRTLAEAEMYELDKSRRSFHKTTQQQKAADAAKVAEAAAAASGNSDGAVAPVRMSDETISSSLWRQYRTTDRKVRKSITRGADSSVEDPNSPVAAASSPVAETATSGVPAEQASVATVEETKLPEGEADSVAPGPDEAKSGASEPPNTSAEDPSPMEIDAPPQREPQQQHQQPPEPALSNDATTALEGSTAGAAAQDLIGARDELATLPGYHFLSAREADLCRTLQLMPQQYLDIKRALLQESLAHGMLDTTATRRSVALIDAERRGNVVDFMVRSGWIAPALSKRSHSGPAPTDMAN